MKEALPHEAQSRKERHIEQGYIEFNRFELCALEAAFAKRPDSVEKIKNAEIAIRTTGKKPLIQRAIGSLEKGRLAITPELAALYLSAAAEERGILEKEKETSSFETCGHSVADHIKALDEVIETLESSPAAQPN